MKTQKEINIKESNKLIFSNLFKNEEERLKRIEQDIDTINSKYNLNDIKGFSKDMVRDTPDSALLDYFENKESEDKFIEKTRFMTKRDFTRLPNCKLTEFTELIDFELSYDNKGNVENPEFIKDYLYTIKEEVHNLSGMENDIDKINKEIDEYNKKYNNYFLEIHRIITKLRNSKLDKNYNVTAGELYTNLYNFNIPNILLICNKLPLNDNGIDDSNKVFVKEMTKIYNKFIENKNDYQRKMEKNLIRYCENDEHIKLDYPNIQYIIKAIDKLYPNGIYKKNKDGIEKYIYNKVLINLVFYIYYIPFGNTIKVKNKNGKRSKFSTHHDIIKSYSIFIILDLFRRIVENDYGNNEIDDKITNIFKDGVMNFIDNIVNDITEL